MNGILKFSLCYALVLAVCNGCNQSGSGNGNSGLVSSVDQQSTETMHEEEKEPIEVVIGNQTWRVENLKVTTFRNGDTIRHAQSDKEWADAALRREPAWCECGGEILYNCYAVNDSRQLAPQGWKIPSLEDFEQLLVNLGITKFNREEGSDDATVDALIEYQWDKKYDNERAAAVQKFRQLGFNALWERYEFGSFTQEEGESNWWLSDYVGTIRSIWNHEVETDILVREWDGKYFSIEEAHSFGNNTWLSTFISNSGNAGEGRQVLVLKGEPLITEQVPVRHNLLMQWDDNNVPLEGEHEFVLKSSYFRVQNFINGLANGPSYDYVQYKGEERLIQSEGEYLEGMKHGHWRFYKGGLKEEGDFKMGLRTGAWKEYDGVQNAFLGNYTPCIKSEGEYVDDKKAGWWTFYYYENNIAEKTLSSKDRYVFENGVKEGMYESYNAKGQLLETGMYANDKRNGCFKQYSQKGIVTREQHYEADRNVGTWKTFDENGKLKSSYQHK
jgi:uncharacterized protein (TIGR02145 family)